MNYTHADANNKTDKETTFFNTKYSTVQRGRNVLNRISEIDFF